MRKAAIIETAESLFFTKGYENTSIQDVLDALSLSKGGFYHHFESKLSLLDAISEKRIESYANQCRAEISLKKLSGIDKLNSALSYSSYLKDNSYDYIAILLKVGYIDGAVMLRDHLKLAAVELFRPIVKEAINEGVAGNIFYVKYSDELSGMLLNLANSLTDEVSSISVSDMDIHDRSTKIAYKTEAYQYAMETLLNAPHGSLKVFGTDIIATINASLMLVEKTQSDRIYAY